MTSLFNKAHFNLQGHVYTWTGWFGCQLESWEWRTLPAGTTRDLKFDGHLTGPIIYLTIYSTKREWFKVRTTWAVSDRGTHQEHTDRINELKDCLRRLV